MATVDGILLIAGLLGIVLNYFRVFALGCALLVCSGTGFLVHYYMGVKLAEIINEHADELGSKQSWNFAAENAWISYAAWIFVILGLLGALAQGRSPKD